MPTKSEQIKGGLVGLLVGDALGVPYEFHSPEAIPPLEAIEFTPPAGFHRTYPGIPAGTWSDDGAQALCLLASLLACDSLNLKDLSQRFLNWYENGYMAVENHVFDVGNQTSRALNAIRAGMPPLEAGMLGKNAKGNGSLMRVLPLVLWHRGTDAELVEAAHLQSRVTHGQITCQVCCALYCLWAKRILEQVANPWQAAVSTLRQLYLSDLLYAVDLEETIRPDQPPHGTGTGYVVDCLHSARLALEAGSYEQVVKAAVALGNDTDTTACVAGGLAGLRDGIEAIPDRWQQQLRGKALFEPLLQKLLIKSP
ncbi:MAG: ADP-ribosylglycohydrolase family protein [Cyanobacteria bacterium RM1_2_2]|nr:ADP-ribosylglycohydrolase family protein [Cyanobacteria bacterium RM1_2_2]